MTLMIVIKTSNGKLQIIHLFRYKLINVVDRDSH